MSKSEKNKTLNISERNHTHTHIKAFPHPKHIYVTERVQTKKKW
jgi:hypothetical protein